MGFNFFNKKESGNNKTQREVRRPAPVDRSYNLVANSDLTKQLYHNQYPGLKLAGALAYGPIAHPVSFMGLPVPNVADSDNANEVLKLIVEQNKGNIRQINTEANREGTVWVYPRYSVEDGRVIWDLIPDASVTRIFYDLKTKKITKIYVEEQVTIADGEVGTKVIDYIRIFTREEVSYSTDGVVERFKNPVGILPIPFANNTDSEEIRGHSDYERILPDLLAYQELTHSMLTDMAKFKTKMAQNVVDVTSWLESNGYGSIADIDIENIDLIMNKSGDQEKTEFIFAEKVADGYIKALEVIFKKIVEGSGLPEIVWGLKTSGNMASVEENMDVLIRYVQDKQDQYSGPYEILFSASLQLMNIVTMSNTNSRVDVSWNNLDAMSESTKAEILAKFAESISKMLQGAVITKKQLYKFWRAAYPEATEETEEEFIAGLKDTAMFKIFSNADYTEIVDEGGKV